MGKRWCFWLMKPEIARRETVPITLNDNTLAMSARRKTALCPLPMDYSREWSYRCVLRSTNPKNDSKLGKITRANRLLALLAMAIAKSHWLQTDWALVGDCHECLHNGEFACRWVQSRLSVVSSSVHSTSVVGQPKEVKKSAQQFTLNRRTVD